MGSLLQDVKYGLRVLARSPGLTAVAVITLALGIGANAAIFSVVNGVLLRPLPYPDPGRLVMLYGSSSRFHEMSVSYLDFKDWQRESRSFSTMAIFRRADFLITGQGNATRIDGKRVSAQFFPVLGVNPALGRNFLPREDALGADPVVMIGASFWQRQFGGAADVLGRSITLDGKAWTIVGVVPKEFQFGEPADVYEPIGQWDSPEMTDRSVHPGLHVVARLAPGTSMAAAQQEMTGIAGQLTTLYPKADAGQAVTVVSLAADMVSEVRSTLLLLLGAVSFVLLIACGNVANLLLARSAARQKEFAIRGALGAGRQRLVRQLLTEGVLLALAGGALGLLVAVWGTRAALAAVPGGLPRTSSVHLDARVVAFLFLVSAITGIVFALAPALRATDADLNETLKEGSRSVAQGGGRLQRALVAGEVALSLVLLVGAGLLLRTLGHLWAVDPGFDPGNVLTMKVALSPGVSSQPVQARLDYRQLLDRVQRIPAIESAAVTDLLPLSGDDSELGFWEGSHAPPPVDRWNWALNYIVTPDYLRLMRIPLVRGRFFTNQDDVASPQVVAIDTVFAREFFPGEDPIGKRINLMVIGPVQIIGVVGHVRHWGLAEDESAKVRAELYFPFFQVPDRFMQEGSIGMTLAVRTRTGPLAAVAAIRGAVLGPGRDQPVYAVETMAQMIADSIARQRFSMLMLGLFAGLALMLAAVGIYGVISYSVSRRTHEIGIRMALGAAPPAVLKLVLREGMGMVLVGLGIGVVAALALTRLLAGLLYGVAATDPLTFVGVVLLLILAALGACVAPAERAMRVAPTTSLRYE
ncbi:MAG TPA: ABC transporter permease [Candidatus Acidoferrales bacterium]|nr:ABC transporter permease [Candidatus Acidoferrales bacterium]